MQQGMQQCGGPKGAAALRFGSCHCYAKPVMLARLAASARLAWKHFCVLLLAKNIFMLPSCVKID